MAKQILDPVPVKTTFGDSTNFDSGVSWNWIKWFQRSQQLINNLFPVAAPAAANSTGNPGQWSYDNGFYYVCVAKNTWRRVAIAAW